MEGGGLILIIAFFAEPPAPGAQCLPMKVLCPIRQRTGRLKLLVGKLPSQFRCGLRVKAFSTCPLHPISWAIARACRAFRAAGFKVSPMTLLKTLNVGVLRGMENDHPSHQQYFNSR
jgi:hypothetical protein